ncbi:MAG: ribosomal RNA small subunit methyltransferase A [Deltaproteobacteria bacterium]|nr:ribosomal RNA small subunit methyltransferase A [Deltaproteobacteria bacterium]
MRVKFEDTESGQDRGGGATTRSKRLFPKKKFGQHFLTDKNLLSKIVRAADIKEGDRVLEVGPGHGALTDALLGAGAIVTAVEIDKDLTARLKARFADYPAFELVCGDALKISFLELSARHGVKLKAVSNLPYNISGPIIFKFIKQRAAFSRLVLMLQKEVADRLASGPGTKNYGAISVLTQLWCDVKVEFNVSRRLFKPPPKVDSSVVSFNIRGAPRVAVADEALFTRVVKSAFGLRRKTLLNALKSLPAEKDDILAASRSAGIDPQRRGETLSMEEFSLLTDAFSKKNVR